MPSLNDVVRDHTTLAGADLEWLHLLVADWQIVADLSFADLVLWLPDAAGTGFWAGAQMRPTTGPTAYVDDLVGSFVPHGQRPLLDAAWSQGRIVREGDPEWRDDVPVRMEVIPVRRSAAMLGLVGRHTNLLGVRTPSRLELTYLQTAADLATMVSQGRFPCAGERSNRADTPRVGDGFVRLDASGVVAYASPNAQSAYRRMGLVGDLVGERLGEVTRRLVGPAEAPVDESVSAVLSGREPRDTEIESGQTTVVLRSVPLTPDGRHQGALVLLRDVTELRRRERELLTREATIREIHHRVKNNLQTVAAMLRMQARRLGGAEGRTALEEAVRRVGSIAVVHETLSQTYDEQVDFDRVADRLCAMVGDVSAAHAPVRTRREGSAGTVPAEVATSLAMVLTELLQNAVEHGLGSRGGTVTLHLGRRPDRLDLAVEDDGAGLPDGFDPRAGDQLGLSIVHTLVETELHGGIGFAARQDGGSRVSLEVPLRARSVGEVRNAGT